MQCLLHGMKNMSIDERKWFEHQELIQVPLDKSPSNHTNGSIFSHMDIFQHDTPSQVLEHLEHLVLRPNPSTDVMPSSWAEIVLKRQVCLFV